MKVDDAMRAGHIYTAGGLIWRCTAHGAVMEKKGTQLVCPCCEFTVMQ